MAEFTSKKIPNAVGAGSQTIYSTYKQSHKPAPSPPLFTSTFTNKFSVHFYFWWVGRVYEIIHFERKWLANPPIRIVCLRIVS